MSLQTQIVELVRAKLSGRKIDVVGFVDELLSLAAGEIHCTLASDHGLRFRTSDGATSDVDLDGCRGKLRMVCARLSVLCNEAPGTQVSPYGGEGIVRLPSSNGKGPQQWALHFKNTPDVQEFSIVPASVEQQSRATAAKT